MTSRFERPHIWSTILRLGNATRLMLSSAQYVAPAASRVRIEAAGKDLGERPVWDDDADAIYHCHRYSSAQLGCKILEQEGASVASFRGVNDCKL